MQVNIRQMKNNNRPVYLFNDNTIVNIKDFESSLLEINKLSFKGVLTISIFYIKCIPTKSLNRVGIDRTNNDKNFLYLFLDDADGHKEENNEIKYSIFTATDKNKKSLKYYTELW